MLNLKKGLAMVLAAATALTFAPVANLGAPVQAEAAAKDQKVSLTYSDTSKEAKSYIDVASGSSRTLKLSLGDSSKINADAEKVTFDNTRSSVATVEATTDGSTTVTDGGAQVKDFTAGATVEVTANQAGTSVLTVNYGSQSKSYTIRVLDAKSTNSTKANVSDVSVATNKTAANAVSAGNVTLDGANYSDNLTVNKPTAPTTASNVVIKDANGNLSSAIDVSFDSDPTVSVDGKTAAFGVNVYNNTAKAGDTFTVTLKGTVDTQPLDGSFKVTVVTPSKPEFTYGGVLKTIYAYKGASYDLAEHASISYTPEGNSADATSTPITLNSNEINWYLVDGAAAPKSTGTTRDTIKSLNIPATAGTVTNGQAGSLKVTVSDPDAFSTAVSDAKIVGEAYIKGVRTIVYVSRSAITVHEITGNVKNINAGISVSKQGQGIAEVDKEIGVLDEKIANPDKDNIYLKASQIKYPVENPTEAQTDNKYDLTVKTGAGNDNPFKGSFLSLNAVYTKANKLPTGNYYETAYIPFRITDNGNSTTYILKVDITVSVNTGVQFRVKDGSSILATTYDEKLATDPTVYLNLADKKTFDIFEHIESDVDKTKVSFSYDKDSANVDVDSKGVITPKSVGNAQVTITAAYNGIKSSAKLIVRVNQYGFDTVTVKGQNGETARVLDVRDYDNNNEKDITKTDSNDSGEYQLVTRQIPYVEIHITGSESSNVVESPVATSANGAKLTYSFDDDVKTMSTRGLTIDPSTGKITLDYNKCKTGAVLGVYAVKVVSAATSKSEATTSYYYVVVDYPDQPIKGLEDNYTVGTCDINNHDLDYTAVALYDESNNTVDNFTEVNKKTDDFKGATYYADDNTSAFDTTAVGLGRDGSIQSPVGVYGVKAAIKRATVDKQTMHVVAFNKQNTGKKVGGTYKLITVTSAPAVENKVTKITNRDTGAVIYDDAKDSTKTAVRLSISDITHLQVTLAYPVAATGSSLVTTKLNGHRSDSDDVVNQDRYVTAVLNSNDIDVTLYPNAKGTQVIGVMPGGHLTTTDRRDIHKKEVKLAVEYDGTNGDTAKPAKITGVKVGNKKGAKVVVKFTKSSLDKNGLSMKYYVQKKVGKKTSGKSIGSTRTTLSVKKGATVKVRVKAYYYDATGQKHVGAYSKWVTKKTDKK